MDSKTKLNRPPALSVREVRAIAKVLADPRRFDIFCRIAANPAVSCGDLLKFSRITAPTLSHHLKELEAARLIEVTRNGKFLNLSMNRSVWVAYLSELQSL